MPRVRIEMPALHPGQQEVWESQARFQVLACGRRWGKALALDTPLPTPDGWTTMGEVSAGDRLYDQRGQPCRVVFVTDVMYGRPCYEVIFSDGSRIVADAEHQWLTWTHNARKATARCARTALGPTVVTTREIRGTLTCAARGDTNHSIDVTEPLVAPEQVLPIAPYVLGAWLGDGDTKAAMLTSADVAVLEEMAAAGCRIGPGKPDVRSKAVRYSIGGAPPLRDLRTGRMLPNDSLQSRLRALGVLKNKHIPQQYLRASVEQRRALLEGLMDTDGSVQPGGHCEFLCCKRALAEGVFELAVSLGIKPTMAEERATLAGRDCGPRYRVSFTPHFFVFRLERKKARQTLMGQSPTLRRRYIVDVQPVPSVPVRCLQVDSPDHLFLAGRTMIPTHNTRLGALRCVVTAIRGGRAWWVAPSYKVAAVGWRLIKQLGQGIEGGILREGERMLTVPTGGTVQVRSADEPDSLRGEGLDDLVMDECGFIAEAAWNEALRPALSDRQGRAMFISTPKSMNWFWRLWLRGQREEETSWAAWQFPTSTNPYIDPLEIEEARQHLPERVFQQEYLAQFLESGGGVFRNVSACIDEGRTENEKAAAACTLGVDLARVEDFTVLTVLDGRGRQLFFERFREISWERQIEAIIRTARRYAAVVIMDSTGVGDPPFEAVRKSGVPVQGYHFTHASKERLIDALAIGLEHGDIRLMDQPQQTAELLAYQYELTPSRNVRMNAPAGMNDDAVIALALAWWGSRRPRPGKPAVGGQRMPAAYLGR